MAVADQQSESLQRNEHRAETDVDASRGGATFLGLNTVIDAHFSLDKKNHLKLQVLDPLAPGWKLLDIVPKLFRRTMGVQSASRIFGELAEDQRDIGFFQKVIDAFNLNVKYRPQNLDHVPKEGSLLVVANHALNGVDGMAIAYIISKVRDDIKIMLTSTFDGFPGLKDHGIFVSASDGPSARSRTESTREAINWLREGHVVVLFPAGQGSYLKVRGRKNPVDVPWLKGTSLLIRRGKADVLPVYVHGAPGKLFLAVRQFSQSAACVLLVREIVNQWGTTVRLDVGDVISHESVAEAGDGEAQMQFLRNKTYALSGDSVETI